MSSIESEINELKQRVSDLEDKPFEHFYIWVTIIALFLAIMGKP